MHVIAVIPAFEEAERIAQTIEGVLPLVDTVVVVDDGSSDQTANIARDKGVVTVRHAINRGQGASLRTGTEAALLLGADVIVHVDADGQHDPSGIPMLIRPISEKKADIVFGSRFLGVTPEGMPRLRRRILLVARLFNALCMGIPRRVTDPQGGMRAMTAFAARSLSFKQDRMAHASEILRLVTRSKFVWCEVPIRVRYTQATLAKGQKSSDALKIVWQLFLGAFH